MDDFGLLSHVCTLPSSSHNQGAQILVFPEDGLQGINFSRSSIYGYLETIPDPQQESWNPCTEPGKHNNTEVYNHTFRFFVTEWHSDMRHCCDDYCLDTETSLGCSEHALMQHQSHTEYSLHLSVVVS